MSEKSDAQKTIEHLTQVEKGQRYQKECLQEVNTGLSKDLATSESRLAALEAENTTLHAQLAAAGKRLVEMLVLEDCTCDEYYEDPADHECFAGQLEHEILPLLSPQADALAVETRLGCLSCGSSDFGKQDKCNICTWCGGKSGFVIEVILGKGG